ncbi:hypothetical protein GFS60_06198 [Rhodococcus sp. WAY2]|nr:hypothetical protein GFS60_06198 [Rhodococcus sp. WAY2]
MKHRSPVPTYILSRSADETADTRSHIVSIQSCLVMAELGAPVAG